MRNWRKLREWSKNCRNLRKWKNWRKLRKWMKNCRK